MRQTQDPRMHLTLDLNPNHRIISLQLVTSRQEVEPALSGFLCVLMYLTECTVIKGYN